MFTIKSTSRQGVVFGHYGTFDDLATAQLVAANVARVTRLKYGSSNTYTAVPVPADVMTKPLHPNYLTS